MPTYRNASPGLSAEQEKAVRAAKDALDSVVDWSQNAEAVEAEYSRLLMALGRSGFEDYLGQWSDEESFEEDGVVWRVAVRSPKNVMTTFGWVKVNRPLFRAKRNGPTRCLVTERAGLFAETWTPRAAKISAMATAELQQRSIGSGRSVPTSRSWPPRTGRRTTGASSRPSSRTSRSWTSSTRWGTSPAD